MLVLLPPPPLEKLSPLAAARVQCCVGVSLVLHCAHHAHIVWVTTRSVRAHVYKLNREA